MSTFIEELQAPVWTAVTRSVTDAHGSTAAFSPEGWSEAPGEELRAEMAQAGAIVAFRLPLSPEAGGAFFLPGPALALFAGEDSPIDGVLEAAVSGACLGLGLSQPSPVSPSAVTFLAPGEALPAWIEASAAFARLSATVTTDAGTASVVLALNEAAVAAASGEPMSSLEPSPRAEPGIEPDLGLLMDVPLELSVELGRVRLPVRNVVELGTGSIVEIDKAAGEPVEVLLNGHLVARGEVVVIDENFGVRITELLRSGESAREAA